MQDGRDSTACAETECNLLVLQRKDFLQLADDFEEIGKDMRIIANSRRAYHQQLIKDVLVKVKNIRELEDGSSMTSFRNKIQKTGSDQNLFNKNKNKRISQMDSLLKGTGGSHKNLDSIGPHKEEPSSESSRIIKVKKVESLVVDGEETVMESAKHKKKRKAEKPEVLPEEKEL